MVSSNGTQTRASRAFSPDASRRFAGFRHPQRNLRTACGKGRFQSHTGCCVWCDRACTCRDLTDHGFQCTEPARMRDPGALLRICTECQKRRKLRYTTHKTANRSLIDGLRFFLSYFWTFAYTWNIKAMIFISSAIILVPPSGFTSFPLFWSIKP